MYIRGRGYGYAHKSYEKVGLATHLACRNLVFGLLGTMWIDPCGVRARDMNSVGDGEGGKGWG